MTVTYRTSPSWQARTLRIAIRITVKPLLRFGGLRIMRAYLALIERIVGHPWLANSSQDTWVSRSTDFGEHLECQDPQWASERVILYLPGGAFIARTPNIHRQLVRRLCDSLRASASIVHYRLAPEHPFPAALDDALQAYDQLLSNGVKAENIVIAGDSAGGGLALSTALSLRDARVQMPAALVLLSPLTDLTFSGDSRYANRWKDPMLPHSRRASDARHYLRRQDPLQPLLSPIFGDFTGLPPLLAQVGSDEILLDDSLRLAERAAAAGIHHSIDVWEKMPHVWHLFPHLPEARKAMESIARFITTLENSDHAV